MSAEHKSSKTRHVTLAVFAVLATAFLGAIAACGSEAADQTFKDDPDTGAVTFNDASFGTSSGTSGNGTSGTLNDGSAPPDATILPDECAGAADREIDCTGKCGPVHDACTGRVKQCGGCPDVGGAKQACDLSTNTCGKPKVTCDDLGAECGTIKNTCGVYLDCPAGTPKGCGEGKECDPDTNKCRECQQVTCQDLGYECGFAYLGCGPDDAAHQTDCGQCAPLGGQDRVCNNQFHTCEPKCKAKTAKEICEAAKASSKGVECGTISDGCGGTVNCDTVAGFGCKTGESCGVHGIANRCDPAAQPDECIAQGRQCGKIVSACTGKEITCGKCKDGETCNDNGVCGPPCTPKKCDVDFKDFSCGTFDDGCGGTVTCGKCATGVCDQTTNTCCKANTCAAKECGKALPLGCGTGTLNCSCGAGETCTTDGKDDPAPSDGTAGVCCTKKTTASYAGKCGTKLTDGCGGKIDVPCGANQDCVDNDTGAKGNAPPDGKAGTCCTRGGDCGSEAAGTCASIPNSCRPDGKPAQTCTNNCKKPTTLCQNGTCCQPAAACALGPGNSNEGAECNVTHDSGGCGSDRTCTCKGANQNCVCGDHVCGTQPGDGAGVCETKQTCDAVIGAGNCGTGVGNGAGGTQNCGCGTGLVCDQTDPGKVGKCVCKNGLGKPYDCTNVPKGGNACGTFDNGCGGTVKCDCTTTGETCYDAPAPSTAPNICCVPPATCSGGGNDGGECNVKHLANGCGADKNCDCAGSRKCLCGDHVCTAADGAGTCKSPLTCSSSQYKNKCGTQLDDGAGGTIPSCGCDSNHQCSETAPGKTGTCVCKTPNGKAYDCSNVPNGPNTGGDACGTFSNGCGGNFTCDCAASGTVCYDKPAPAPNTCCKPLACPAVPGEGTLCGTNIDNTCGGKLASCGCPQPTGSGDQRNNTEWQCTANKCHCVPRTCEGRAGAVPDGCGNTITCGG